MNTPLVIMKRSPKVSDHEQQQRLAQAFDVPFERRDRCSNASRCARASSSLAPPGLSLSRVRCHVGRLRPVRDLDTITLSNQPSGTPASTRPVATRGAYGQNNTAQESL